MARSNPYKKPLRRARATALLVVEGETEEAFCNYLKRLYGRDTGLAVSIHNARGMSPDNIVEVARSKCCQISFDRVFILLDQVPPFQLGKSKQTIHALKATVWWSEPDCIEGFFLSMMGSKPKPGADSTYCKSHFHKDGLSESQKLEWERYGKLFPKERHDDLRKSHPMLDNLIRLFSNTL